MTDYSKDLLLPLVGTVEGLDAAERSHSESVDANWKLRQGGTSPRSGNAQPIAQLPSAAFPGLRTAGPRSKRPDRRALRRKPGRGLGPEEQAQPETPEIQSEESTATIVRDQVPGPTPGRQISEYQTALLSLKPKEKDLASASRASLVRWAGLVVQVEDPLNVSKAARGIYAAADITRSSKRVQSAVNETVTSLSRQAVPQGLSDYCGATT